MNVGQIVSDLQWDGDAATAVAIAERPIPFFLKGKQPAEYIIVKLIIKVGAPRIERRVLLDEDKNATRIFTKLSEAYDFAAYLVANPDADVKFY